MTYRALLTHQAARRYLIAQSISALGDSAMWLACAIWIKDLTGSSSAAGMTFFFYLLAALAAPVGGLVADKFRRGRLLIVLNLAGAGIVAVLLLVGGAHDVWIIYAVMTAYGAIAVALGPAQSGLMTTLLPPELLGSANSALRGTQESLRLLAPILGAGVYALAGPKTVVTIDAGTFVIAALVLLTLRRDDPYPTPAEGNVLGRLTAGIVYVTRHADLRRLIAASMVFMLLAGLGESVRWVIVSVGLHRPAEYMGTLQFVMGAGAILGGLGSGPALHRFGEARIVGLGLLSFALGSALCVGPPVSIYIGSVLVGAGAPALVIGAITMLQQASTRDIQGRTFSAFEFLTTAPQIVSIALGAALITVVDYRILLLAITAAATISGVVMLRAPRLTATPKVQTAAAAGPEL